MFCACLLFFNIFLVIGVSSQDEFIRKTKSEFTHFESHFRSQEQIGTSFMESSPGNDEPELCRELPNRPTNGQISCSRSAKCFATCNNYHQFPNGAETLLITCQDGKWKIPDTDGSIVPDCQPFCLPACLNNGICIGPNQCECPENFSGPQCQFETRPCLNLPPAVQNSRRRCNEQTCTVSCMDGFTFPDGSSVSNINCREGNWVPSRSDWPSIPDCIPVCSPPCKNGGICLALNTCQCPQDFRGESCQFHVDHCNIGKLGFNGGYQCHGDTYSYSCTLNCPEGIEFSSPPAAEYICKYDTGVFEPQPVPQCQTKPGSEIITIGSSKNSYVKTTNHFWRLERSQSRMMWGEDVISGFKKLGQGKIKGEVKSGAVKGGHYEVHQDPEDTVPDIYQPFANSSSEVDVKRPEAKTCFTWGGSHYKTFDGAIYSFSSNCPYILLQDSQDGIVTVIIQNSLGCHNGGACHKIIKIFLEGKEFMITLNEFGNPMFRTVKKLLPIPAQLTGIRVQMSAHFVIISLDSVGASIKWDGGLFVQVKASESLWDRTAGLCGRMNGDARDDRTGRDRNHHMTVAAFTADWKADNIGEMCDDYEHNEHSCGNDLILRGEAEIFCEKLFSDTKFQDCSKIVDLGSLKATCLWDFCGCKNADRSSCACDTMSVYVRQCYHDGIIKSVVWRKEEICPMRCGDGKIYKSCGPQYQSSCNDDAASKGNVDELECEEGCFCPEGTVLHEGNCISVEECPCRLRGKVFQPGAVIPKQCNTCTCVAGKWTCTQVACEARCAAVGDPHYVTFDGKHYDFMGKCGYYLVKGDNYSIETENVACSGAISEAMGFSRENSSELPSCTKSVTIRLSTAVISLQQNRRITIDDKDVPKLPISTSGVKIRMASSIFVVAELANGLEIWWDGVSRVYVNAPPEFQGKTKGLCGTFTGNQRNDFLTPFGDVEQSVVDFANKWKVTEQCEDIPQKDFSHPCDANPERLATAEKHCSRIWSDLFASCHWHVDPDTFYKDCKYDMCACEDTITHCLCPTLAAYAKECAANDVKILWRMEVEECQLHCPPDQEYQICGNSCTRSCSDISFNEGCRQECVEGCNCPEGQTINAYGECIPIGQCPCTFNGMEFKAGHKEIRPGRTSQDLCTCFGGLWNCKSATKEEIEEFPPITLNNVCSATKNQVATTCEPVEPRTCRNMHEPVNQSPTICLPGCICKDGYVLDSVTNECVMMENCPCYHGGRSYKDNSTMQEECNTCRCERGNWKCSERICSGVCSAWGDSHYKTFDDRTYDFQGICDYVLVKSSLGGDDCFEISTQNVPCGTSGVACSKSVTLTVGNGNKQEKIILTRGNALPSGNFQRIVTREAGQFVFLNVPDLGLTLQWDKGTRIYVKLEPKWKTKTRGLCGDYNDNSEDDFKTPSGGISEASPRIFGDSWKKDNYCPEPKDISDTCTLHPERKTWAIDKCGVLKSSLFQSCHSEVDIEPYIERCIFDTCGCNGGGDCECLCTSLAAYAHECNRRGVPVKWRSQELCPMQCDEKCSSYSPCISTCQTETCDHLSHLRDGSRLCVADTCIEGCLMKSCPDGQVWRNSSFHDCVPRSDCKPICLERNNSVYYEGDIISSDSCQTCFCSRGKVICNGAPCTTVEPTTIPMIQPGKCVSGWTNWLNRHSPKRVPIEKSPIKHMVKGRIKGSETSMDIEPLPSMIELFTLKNSSRCERSFMVDIRCRTVDEHLTPKDTGLDVECSLERGLYCTAERNEICPDFEISILCRCDDDTTESSTTTTTSEPVTNDPRDECKLDTTTFSLQDCSVFYECMPTPNGNKLVKKTCGSTMYYNTQSKTCDWPQTVALFRPECRSITTTESPNPCKPGEEFKVCAIDCRQTCDMFHHLLIDERLCGNGSECIAGCVEEGKTCSSDKVWRDAVTCVEPQDCPCRSHNGSSIKPGVVVQESQCEVCQCVNNYYSCDSSICATEIVTQVTPTQSSSRPLIEESTTIVPDTATPPEPCASGKYKNLLGNIIVDSTNDLPAKSSIEGTIKPLSLDEYWEPSLQDDEQFLDIKLTQTELIYGLTVQGNPDKDRYVTSYEVLFSKDGRTFSYLSDQFKGPIDAFVPVTQMFRQPIEAKFIRINPQSWEGGISMRVGVLGCQDMTEATTMIPTATPVYEVTSPEPMCDDPMGLDNGIMIEEQVTASSYLDSLIPSLSLSSPGIWRPQLDNPHQFIEFNFRENRNLTGVETKGADDIWTTAYKVSYGTNSREWNPIVDDKGEEKVFLGNFDDVTSKTNYFEYPINAQYLKIQPVKWHNHVGMKVEVHGCYVPYPIPTTSLPKIVENPCNVCRGVLEDSRDCKCEKPFFWDGVSCVEKKYCPCMIKGIPYRVGSIYETDECDKCTCTLGGIPECRKKSCESCEDPTMKTYVTELCGCICKPCPEGQRLCRTSNICIDESLWCNGVKDCSDDETGCTTQRPDVLEVISNKTVTTTNTTAEKNVTAVTTCEVPTCPPKFTLVPVKGSSKKGRPTRPPPPFFGGNKRKQFQVRGFAPLKGFAPVKGVKTYPRVAKQPRINDLNIQEAEDCKEYSCVPKVFPTHPGGKTREDCPKPECPPNHRMVFEPQSMYNPQPCPRWRCQPPRQPDVVCHVDGKMFTTFDKLEYKYDICNHILARDMYFNKWYITLENHCDVPKKPCTKVVAIVLDDDVIVLYPNRSVEINEYTFTSHQIKHYQDIKGKFRVFLVGNKINFSSQKYRFFVVFNEDSVCIGVNPRLKGRIDGLCGYFDGNMKNDKQTPDGIQAKTTDVFGDSWVMDGTPECDTQGCSKEMYAQAKEICSTIHDKSFQSCLNVLNVKNLIAKCVESTCMCINSNSTTEECRCRSLTAFTTDCQAAEESIDLSSWRDIYNCPMHCPAPLIYKDCFRNECEESCDNLQEIEPCPYIPKVCFPGCFCPDGLVRHGEECIAPTECRDCACDGFGNTNFMTFDRRNFTFAGNCTYILSQDIINPNVEGVKTGSQQQPEQHTYQILMTNVACERGICTETLTVIYKGHFLEAKQNKNHEEPLVTLDGTPIDKLPVKNSWMNIERVSQKDIKILIFSIKLEITIYEHNFAFNIRLPSHIFGEAVEGLCGNCNADADDDFKMKNGEMTENVDDFGMSWLATGLPTVRILDETTCLSQPPKPCLPPPAPEDICMTLLNREIFGQCHKLIDPMPYLDSCHNTLCENGETCGDFERYAGACREAGFCTDWRTSNICPFTCKEDLVYRACESSCFETCDTLSAIEKQACSYTLTEGCFCPEDHVWHNGTCMATKNCFTCDDQGHVDGDIWHPDKCTTCSCDGKNLKCKTTECPSIETICEENYTPILVETSADECCNKYRCAPVPTVPPTCLEPQTLECAYGQIMKLTKGPDGCSKFICECLPPEDCPLIDNETTADAETLQPGYIWSINTSGCCPRKESYCSPETCPSENCPEYYTVKSKNYSDACCPTYECLPPDDLCLYSMISDNDTELVNDGNTTIIPKKIGEVWTEGLCSECTCEFNHGTPQSHCTTKSCDKPETHPDHDDYILALLEIGECCPQYQRIACKAGQMVYEIGSTWQPDGNDACHLEKCENTTKGIQKTITTRECKKECDEGYEYRSPADPGKQCCGSCVPIVCIFEGTSKNINEEWQSVDFCTNYTCILENGKLRVKESVTFCENINPTEEENYEILWQRIPKVCCPKPTRTACKVNGTVHYLGETVKTPDDACLTLTCAASNEQIQLEKFRQRCNETCDLGWKYMPPKTGECCGTCKQTHCVENGILHEPGAFWSSRDICAKFECKETENGLRIKESHQRCNDSCTFGWEYRTPVDGECCGSCKQAYCIDNEVLHQPNSIWKSEDNCWTYECKVKDDQLMMVSSAPTCPDIQNCAEENIYTDGCCKRCKPTIESKVECAAEVLESRLTVGKVQEYGPYGLCTNKAEIAEYTECRGACDTEVKFSRPNWYQQSLCHCCQPKAFKQIVVQLECSDGRTGTVRISVPTACSCEACGSTSQIPVKGRVKGGKRPTKG
ncbi:hemocytin [Fopius arisanus]|uniref:Hemocytin n=1 Tax=Fopius arisanus TaxID=64838 RepID=A0A9R1T5U0_9HYME|nr:PREDICTED: hemocytin [Fopius arisanus]